MIKIYETDRLFVSPFLEEDLNDETYNSWFYDQEVTKYNSHGLFPYTKKQKESFMNEIDSKERIVWKVMLSQKITEFDTHKIASIWIGNISLQSFNWINRSAEFAIVLGDKNYWGKGYGTEALRLLIDHGFNKLHLNRIWTGTASINVGMNKIATNLGMDAEGQFREAVYLDGDYEDVTVYGILKEEWKND